MLRSVLNEMRYSRCHFLDFPPFDRVDRVDMVAHFCRKGSKAFHATWSRNLYERQRQMEYILSCAIRSQEGLCSSNFHIHLASRAGQLRTYHLEKNWNDGKIIIEYNLLQKSCVLYFNYACVVRTDSGKKYETWFYLELDETCGRDLSNIATEELI